MLGKRFSLDGDSVALADCTQLKLFRITILTGGRMPCQFHSAPVVSKRSVMGQFISDLISFLFLLRVDKSAVKKKSTYGVEGKRVIIIIINYLQEPLSNLGLNRRSASKPKISM